MEKAAFDTASQAKGSPGAPRGSRTPTRQGWPPRVPEAYRSPPACTVKSWNPRRRRPATARSTPQPFASPPRPTCIPARRSRALQGASDPGRPGGSISRSRKETSRQACAISAPVGTRDGSPSPKRQTPRSAAQVGSKSPPVRSAPSFPARSTWQRSPGRETARPEPARGVQRRERRPGAPLVHRVVDPGEDREGLVDRGEQLGRDRSGDGDRHHRGHGRPGLRVERDGPDRSGRQGRAGRREEREGGEETVHGRFPRAGHPACAVPSPSTR